MYPFFKATYSLVWSWIAAVLSPPTCAGCYHFLDERVPLCATCDEKIRPVISSELVVNHRYTLKVFAVSEYVGVIRTLIMAKQTGSRLPSKQLGALIAQRCLADWANYDYIIPVPLHWRRYAQRGFNQSYEMAKIIAEVHALTVSCGVVRKRSTRYQTTLEQHARRSNVYNAFEVTQEASEFYQGKRLLLVDDVLTTGSTLREIARVLATCRPVSIHVVVAARVVLK